KRADCSPGSFRLQSVTDTATTIHAYAFRTRVDGGMLYCRQVGGVAAIHSCRGAYCTTDMRRRAPTVVQCLVSGREGCRVAHTKEPLPSKYTTILSPRIWVVI